LVTNAFPQSSLNSNSMGELCMSCREDDEGEMGSRNNYRP